MKTKKTTLKLSTTESDRLRRSLKHRIEQIQTRLGQLQSERYEILELIAKLDGDKNV
jgi:predicted  nucleic acid-binding Zn-ribbon protein